jgi:hypothetical protein
VTSNGGGDYIATGIGQGDMVTVGAHTNADTFAFALGTNGSAFTEVIGALKGDQVAVNSNGNGNALGNTLVPQITILPGSTLASFIGSLTLTKGDTYTALNDVDGTTGGPMTYVVTDTQSGRIGAIELVGLHTVSMSNHVLTLES